MAETKKISEEAMSRGDFFRWGLKSLKEKTVESALKSFGTFNALVNLTGEKWHKVGLLEELTERPKLKFLQGRPFYLARIGEEVVGLSAACPVDNNLLQWQEHLSRFHCLHCKHSFSRKGHPLGQEQGKKMILYKSKVEDESVYLNLE